MEIPCNKSKLEELLGFCEDIIPALLTDESLRAYQTLTERQRTCFVLHNYYGYKYREIAEMLDITEDAVTRRIYLANCKLFDSKKMA